MRSLAVNGASNRLSCSKDFLDSSGQVLGDGTWPHNTCSAEDVIHGDVTVVLDVLDLLPVTWRLLQGLDDEGSGGGDDGNGSLPVLDGQLDGDLETFPVLGGL